MARALQIGSILLPLPEAFPSSGQVLGVQGGVMAWITSALFPSSGAAVVPLTVQGFSGQTADLIDVTNSAGSILAKIDANGYLGIGNGSTANGAAIEVQIASTTLYTGRFRQDQNANTDAVFRFEKTRSGGVITANDKIASFQMAFHDGTAIRSQSQFGARSSGAPANNNSPAQLWFGVTPGWNSTDQYGDKACQIIIDGPSAAVTIAPNIGTAGTAAQTTAQLGVIAVTATQRVLTIQAAASQSTQIFEARNSSGTELLGIGSLGQLRVKSGANLRIGQATLIAGAIVVSNTSVTANTRIFVTVSTAGGTQGFLKVTKTAGTSFTITSTSATETSTVDWFMVESI
jgi:hypothetical protein